MSPAKSWLTEIKSTPVVQIEGSVQDFVSTPEFDMKHLKKTEEHIGRNVVIMTKNEVNSPNILSNNKYRSCRLIKFYHKPCETIYLSGFKRLMISYQTFCKFTYFVIEMVRITCRLIRTDQCKISLWVLSWDHIAIQAIKKMQSGAKIQFLSISINFLESVGAVMRSHSNSSYEPIKKNAVGC